MVAPGALLAGRYRLEALLGSGGSGHTYRAADLATGASVALKLLHDAPGIASFRAEFARLIELSHPHLVRVHDYGRAAVAGQLLPFFTCDLVTGSSLRVHCAAHGWDASEQAVRDALSALAFLHRLGLRHGDLKPDNVLVDAHGRGTLIDLGCSVASGERAMIGGTPSYFAPELVRGEPADARADLYALGLSLRELGASGHFLELAERCLHKAASARPSSLASACSEVGLELALAGPHLGKVAPLLGRGAALESASASLTRVARGEHGPRVIWVQGPRGIGTTRFLRELCFRAPLPLQLCEQQAARESIRATLSRAFGPVASGVEGLVHGVAKRAARSTPAVLVVHDLDRAKSDDEAELLLALTSTPANGNLSWLVSSTRPPERKLDCLHLSLAPLGLPELSAWAGKRMPESELPALLEHTGGFPLYVERTLSALAAGRPLIATFDSAQREPAESAALLLLISDLDAQERTLLACLALGLNAPSEPSARLLERGLVRVENTGPALVRGGDAAALLHVLPDKLLAPLCLRAADNAAREPSLEALGRRIAYLARGGRVDEALRVFRSEAERASEEPRALTGRVETLVQHMSAADLTLFASLLRKSGEPTRALNALARALRKSGAQVRDALYLEAAECFLALGNVARAEQSLAKLQTKEAVLGLECTLRLRIRQADYEGARALANEALSTDPPPALRARLYESLALASAHVGRHDEAQRALDEAERSEPEPGARKLARRCSLRGFLGMRSGDAARALAPYEKALALADKLGLSDLVANALSNLASAKHMLGSYGSARELYERALSMARALGRRHSERYLRVNLANLALECGALDEAETRLDALAEEERSAHGDAEKTPFSAALRRYRAELWLLRAEPDRALALLESVPEDDERELRECLLLRAEAELALQRNEAASATLAEGALSRDVEPDLEARRALLEARLLFAQLRESEALAVLERALEAARKTGLTPLTARVEGELAAAYARAGSPTLEREHARRARASWERMALDLKSSERDAFLRHPQRALASAPEAAPLRGKSSLSFARVIELSRRINAQRTVDDVLNFALDAAIELASAERGFVLLFDAQTRSFEVKSARAVDKHPLDNSAFEWSRSIAEQVTQSGEPVITLDAAQDARFLGQASVHAMGLKSVLCVPVIGARGLRGALYLDNRYLRSRFSEADAELVQAFSEQVAVALGNAQLFLELEQKQRELLRKQRKVEELLQGKEREVERLEVALAEARVRDTRYRYRDIVGTSSALRRMFATLDRVIPTDLPVIVLGESGTGKELVARALHDEGPRSKKPFVSINCAALPEPLLESELFGYVKGAFTGAERDKPGLFVSAHGGTLFLDELGELPLSLQVKLLRVLAERALRPLGATRSVPVDVRIVAATNRDLAGMVAAKSFREDLYYRLNVVEIALPPLRERREDILPIAEHVLARRAQEHSGKAKRLSSGALSRLLAHAFPGNVRELENVLLRAEALCEGDTIRAADLGLTKDVVPLSKQQARSRAEYAHQESQLLLETLERERWNVSNVSRSLGIPRNTLYRKLTRLGFVPAQSREPKLKKR